MRTTPLRSLAVAGALAAVVSLPACDGGSGPAAPPGDADIALDLVGLRPIDPASEGSYEAWIIDRSGQAHSAGKFTPGAGGVEVVNPVDDAVAVEITIEPPGDDDPAPSLQRLLRGDLRRGVAQLSLAGAITLGGTPLHENPGQWTVFTPSDNHVDPYPSNEYSGVWLFNMRPRLTPQGDSWVRLTPLREGWVYEGWMVRDIDTPDAIWLSYGKFRPDATGAVNDRDDTGWGPFSGVDDYRTAGAEDFPGDDWVSNPLGFTVPGNLKLPLDLSETDDTGNYRWTHVITIEPAFDQDEPITTEQPFMIRPYVDLYVDGRPGDPRVITYRADGLPGGTATAQ